MHVSLTPRLEELDRLRGALEKGDASGSAREFDFDAFMEEFDGEAEQGGV